MNQTVLTGIGEYRGLSGLLNELKSQKFLLVCDQSFPYLNIDEYLYSIEIPFIKFNEFTPNPLYEDVCKGVRLFNDEHCDTIVAIGGGSTLDVAKCIKLYCRMDHSINYLTQEYTDSGIKLIAMPTTAGTGSESTCYAVIYYEGKKQSVTHTSIIPDYAILNPDFLKTLPLYQKKCTMLDALCQGIESWWSINSTEESREYSRITVETIVKYMKPYINGNDDEAAEKIMIAANYSGRAINITQTTAAHAMSYKLTSMYGIPHGHAVALCLPEVWEYMSKHLDKCIDGRGIEHLDKVFLKIANLLGKDYVNDAIRSFRSLLEEMKMTYPAANDYDAELMLLMQSVNPVRLKNNPVLLDDAAIHSLYERIIKR